jgi:hypothetical protein
MKSIKKRLMRAHLKHYKNTKKESKNMILIWTTKMSKCMANASFYMPKFRTIDLMTNCWVGGHILTWWQSLSSCLNKTSLVISDYEQILYESSGTLSHLSNKIRIGVFGLLKLEIWAEH